jgi:hypothetical protein
MNIPISSSREFIWRPLWPGRRLGADSVRILRLNNLNFDVETASQKMRIFKSCPRFLSRLMQGKDESSIKKPSSLRIDQYLTLPACGFNLQSLRNRLNKKTVFKTGRNLREIIFIKKSQKESHSRTGRIPCIRNYVLLKPRNLTRQKYTRCRSIRAPVDSSWDLIGSIICALNYLNAFARNPTVFIIE